MLNLTTPWKKVLLDLWEHRGRTMVVALAIAVGVYAIGVVLNTREILVREYRRDQDAALVGSAVVYTAPFEQDLADAVARLPLVVAAEGRRSVQGRILRGPGDSQPLMLVAAPDFNRMQVDRVRPVTGEFPPGRRNLALESASFTALGYKIGDVLEIELSNGAVRKLTVTGSVHDASMFSPSLSGVAIGYVIPETMEELGYAHTFSELRLRVTEPSRDENHILSAVDEVERYLKDSGRTVLTRNVITEARADPYIDTIVLILTAFGLVILLLSGFLVVNAMTALITQQIPQIGVMKLIGARRSQIMALYLTTVMVYGVIAVLIALPLAALTARLLMTEVVEPLLNVQVHGYDIPLAMLVAQAAVGLLLPVGAGLAPVLRGTRISTQQALNDTGMGAGEGGPGSEGIWRRTRRSRYVQRPAVLAIRNTLRHPGRLAQTLVVLVFGTALFIAVLSVRSSVNATLGSFMRFHQYDVSVQMQHPELIARLEAAGLSTPGASGVEVWSGGQARRVHPDDSKSDAFRVVAVPPDTTFMQPDMISGQWLAQSATTVTNGVVINSDLIDAERDLGLGSKIVLDLDGRESTWQVVGIVSTESRGPAVYVSRDDYAYAARAVGEGTRLQVRGGPHDKASQQILAAALYERLEAQGLEVDSTHTTVSIQTENRLLFEVVVTFLVLMALLLAGVGGLGLTTTMSINVMERVREVGVLRAIGASNSAVRWIVVAEGLAVAAVSWAVGAVLSVFLSPAFSNLLGVALIKIPLDYRYSLPGAADLARRPRRDCAHRQPWPGAQRGSADRPRGARL